MRARSRRRLGIAVLLISILGIGAYLFRGHISYLWLQNVTVPRMNSLLAAQADGVEVFEATIVQKIAHNPKHFVQGLQFDGDILWEGTGLYGESKLIKQRFNWTAGTLEPLTRRRCLPMTLVRALPYLTKPFINSPGKPGASIATISLEKNLCCSSHCATIGKGGV